MPAEQPSCFAASQNGTAIPTQAQGGTPNPTPDLPPSGPNPDAPIPDPDVPPGPGDPPNPTPDLPPGR